MNKELAIALVVWTFFGVYSHEAWPELLRVNLSISMLLSAFLAISLLKANRYVFLIIIPMQQFSYRLMLLFHHVREVDPDMKRIVMFSVISALVTFTLTLYLNIQKNARAN